ncbi:MAG: hypothetical protein HY908_06500 [Myxococcales bacterium]|nr:hypothetical protein [Myxococcales bacterium]MCC6522913.1 hypothetical protein [Polyangiaceae bacterium]
MTDLSLEILKQIRDELKQSNERLDRLERRQTETEVRLATELVAVATAVRDLRDVLLEDRKLRETMNDHERRITVLERRAG